MSVGPRRRNHPIAPGLAGFPVVLYTTSSVPPRTDVATSFKRWREYSAALIEQRLAYDLRRARERADVPQWLLAERLGRAQSFIAKLETYTPSRHLRVCELVQLCALMQRNPGELLSSIVDQPSVRDILAAAPPYRKPRHKR